MPIKADSGCDGEASSVLCDQKCKKNKKTNTSPATLGENLLGERLWVQSGVVEMKVWNRSRHSLTSELLRQPHIIVIGFVRLAAGVCRKAELS
jgi:hypothetical protein